VDEIRGEMRKAAFNHNSDPDWRDPDGNRLYALKEENFSTNTLLHEAHEPYKLLTKENYGILLGCVLNRLGPKADNLQLIDEVLQARTNNLLFPIGQKKIVQCLKEEGNRMKLHFPPTDHDKIMTEDIIIDSTEGQLVLMVNDIVFTRTVLENFIANTNATPEDKAGYEMTKNAIFGSEIATKMDSSTLNLFASELWYWDNNGIFTVMIKKAGDD
jgi:hypothetical protein